ncbi:MULTISPECIES: alpha/beta hydrolase [Pseudomonas]|uniref:Alpha/beta hydrolase n=1 Tax=Pseudomonas juntendi TaxID=2666183 RepID=A0A7W2QVZ4_9PSED|nr:MULTISPECIES: alpha/beta hydrolase [Pseudomonas]MBA6144340.1 alpha/beta hydrolase [Pseudomonas juntendi]QEQ87080.1 alpha/beta hydrolase [Pseudomonas putida]RRV18427.1 alpha/beta hydrolase [Pseudomonas sp. p99-361]RRV68313.1 alpha/beta hydrolase [Pseudomonas sp. p99-361]
MQGSSIPLDFPERDQIIYKSDNLVALHCKSSEVPSRQLVIAFHALQLTHNLELPRRGQSRETLRAAGLDSIQIVPRGNHWYQYADIEAMMAEVRLVAEEYIETIAYGQSMGAYAAIHTSALLRPTKILAICPQFSIDPRKISFDSGFARLAASISFIRDDIKKNACQDTEIVIAYDQLLPHDYRHYLEYERHLKNVYRLRMPFCGHGVSEALKEAGMIPGQLIKLITDGKDQINSTRQIFRRHRLRIPKYQDALRLSLTKWYMKHKKLDKASDQAFKLYESNRRFSSLQLYCEVAEKLGTPERAAARWFFAISIYPKTPPSLSYVRAVKYSRLAGDISIAKTTCLKALTIYPKDFGLMREHLDILIQTSDFLGAKKIATELQDTHGSKAADVIQNRKTILFNKN